MNITELRNIVGTLSFTSKIPSPGFSTSAFECKTGNKLSKITGSICHDCYAKHGNHLWKNSKKSYLKRSQAIDEPYWASYMVELIRKTEHISKHNGQPTGYFRWFNSGDLKNESHLQKIIWIANQTPEIGRANGPGARPSRRPPVSGR